eukprot:scaffold4274_cov175-Amphora_coffeaeformis.AAC.11
MRPPAQSDTHSTSAESSMNVVATTSIATTTVTTRISSTKVVVEDEGREDIETVHQSFEFSEVEDRSLNTASADDAYDGAYDDAGIFLGGCSPTMAQYFTSTFRSTSGFGGRADENQDGDKILDDNHEVKKTQGEENSEVPNRSTRSSKTQDTTPKIEAEVSTDNIQKPNIMFLEKVTLTNEDEEVALKPKSPYISKLLSPSVSYDSWGHVPTRSNMDCSTRIEQVLSETESFGENGDPKETNNKHKTEPQVTTSPLGKSKSEGNNSFFHKTKISTEGTPSEPDQAEESHAPNLGLKQTPLNQAERRIIKSSPKVHDVAPLTTSNKPSVKEERKTLLGRWRKIVGKRSSKTHQESMTPLASLPTKSASLQMIQPQIVPASKNDDSQSLKEEHHTSPLLDPPTLAAPSRSFMQFIESQSSLFGLQILPEDVGDNENNTGDSHEGTNAIKEASNDHELYSENGRRATKETDLDVAIAKQAVGDSLHSSLFQSFSDSSSKAPTEPQEVNSRGVPDETERKTKKTEKSMNHIFKPGNPANEESLSEHQVPTTSDTKSISSRFLRSVGKPRTEKVLADSPLSHNPSSPDKTKSVIHQEGQSRPGERSIRTGNACTSHRPGVSAEVESALSFNSEVSSVIFQEQDCWNPLPSKTPQRRLAAKSPSLPKSTWKPRTKDGTILRSETVGSMDSNKLIEEGHCAPTMFRETSIASSYVNTVLLTGQRSFEQKTDDFFASEANDDESTVMPLRDVGYNDGFCGCDEIVEYEVDYPEQSHSKDDLTDDSSHVCEDLRDKTLTLPQNQNDMVVDDLTDLSSLITTPTQRNTDTSSSRSGVARTKMSSNMNGRTLTYTPKQNVAVADNLTDLSSMVSTPTQQNAIHSSICPSEPRIKVQTILNGKSLPSAQKQHDKEVDDLTDVSSSLFSSLTPKDTINSSFRSTVTRTKAPNYSSAFVLGDVNEGTNYIMHLDPVKEEPKHTDPLFKVLGAQSKRGIKSKSAGRDTEKTFKSRRDFLRKNRKVDGNSDDLFCLLGSPV